MPLSDEFAKKHIALWTEKLQRPPARDYRALWPRFLFRHERLENVVEILKTSKLLSRNDAKGKIIHDVAAPEIIDNMKTAHSFARLYFRPLNPTQYSIEGIKKASELQFGSEAHAPVLVMLIFKAQKVLCLSGVNFSNANMQSPTTNFGLDENFFKKINFDDVFHEGSYPQNSPIKLARCAEVLAPSPLALDDNLVAVICRSSAERRTLLHSLGTHRKDWFDKIKIWSKPGIFQSKWAYVDTVDLTANMLNFSFHPRDDSKEVEVKIVIHDSNNSTIQTWNGLLDPSTRWQLKVNNLSGTYSVSIWLEKQLAYCAVTTIDDLPF